MNKDLTKGNPQKVLWAFCLPMFGSIIFQQLYNIADSLVAGKFIGENALAAVGNSYNITLIFIAFAFGCNMGCSVIVSQLFGAKDYVRMKTSVYTTLIASAVLCAGLMLAGFLSCDVLLRLMRTQEEIMADSALYLDIYILGLPFLFFYNIATGIFSALGDSKTPFFFLAFSSTANIAVDLLFVISFQMGVAGVAWATVLSRILNLGIVIVASKLLVKAKEDPERLKNTEVFAQIIKVGLPSALETALYNVAMTLTIRFLNQMDASGFNVTARAYAAQIANFSYCAGAALAQANAIMTGWRIGEGDYEACDKGTKKAACIGILVAAGLEALFVFSADVLIRIFTQDLEMIRLVKTLLAIDILLEVGRVTNLVFGQALKTSGDAVYTTVIGVLFMYLCMVGGTWFFGIHLNLLAVGAYIGLTIDECVRAVFMFLRWQSGKWRTKGFIQRRAEA